MIYLRNILLNVQLEIVYNVRSRAYRSYYANKKQCFVLYISRTVAATGWVEKKENTDQHGPFFKHITRIISMCYDCSKGTSSVMSLGYEL
jgi:hypothetical protein